MQSVAGIVCSTPAGWHGSHFLVIVVSCQVDISGIARFLAQRSPTVCMCVCVRAGLLNVIVHNNFPLNLRVHSITRIGQTRKKGKLTDNYR